MWQDHYIIIILFLSLGRLVPTLFLYNLHFHQGASVLRMLESTLGEKIFQEAITNYLNAHKWGNAVTQNLWDELQAIVGNKLNITDFMNTWTIQMGYPILNVTSANDHYILTQKRFLKNPDVDDQDKSSPLG